MTEPQIILSDSAGFHNRDLKRAQQRLKAGKQYKDLSTVCVIPTRDNVAPRVVESWLNLMSPMNNRFVRMFVQGMEIGDAYEQAVELILTHPMLKDFKYMLTLESDNMPPPDGLLRLYESLGDYASIAGLYWTKGEGGQPMIYGNPKELLGFQPQMPVVDKVQECNGTGMGFTLFDLDVFRDKKLERPWFKTVQGPEGMGTQDLYFFGKIRKLGYRVASDNRVKVGHFDESTGIVW